MSMIIVNIEQLHITQTMFFRKESKNQKKKNPIKTLSYDAKLNLANKYIK